MVILREPCGNEVECSDIKFLENLIINEDQNYWNYGSGDFRIYYQSLAGPSLVLVYCNELDGFYIQFFPKQGANDWDVAMNDLTSMKVTEISYGGNIYKIFDSFIISRHNTLQIVYDFIHSGKNQRLVNGKITGISIGQQFSVPI